MVGAEEMSGINWAQVLLGGTFGTIFAFLLARGLDVVRGRPRLDVRLLETRERLYVRDIGGVGGGSALYTASFLHHDSILVVTLDLGCINKGYQADGLLSAALLAPGLGWAAPVFGRVRLDEAFNGLNVPSHSIAAVRLRFFLRKESHGGRPGFGMLPLWSAESLPDLTLKIETVRGSEYSFWPIRSKSTREIQVRGGQVVLSHQAEPRTVIPYLLTQAPSGLSAGRKRSPLHWLIR
jgi:hypothetical protein